MNLLTLHDTWMPVSGLKLTPCLQFLQHDSCQKEAQSGVWTGSLGFQDAGIVMNHSGSCAGVGVKGRMSHSSEW